MTGIEPWAISVVGGLAVPLFQSISTTLSSFSGMMDGKLRERIYAASRQYERKYQKRHGILQVLGMRKPVSLNSVYTAVQFLNYKSLQSFESIDDLEKGFREAQSRRFQSQYSPRQAGIEVANNEQYLMVLGEPGTGKSTFLRHLGIEVLKGARDQFIHRCIPVFIELKKLVSGDISIEKLIEEEFKICNFPSPDKFREKALEEGKLLILFDAIDEIPHDNLCHAINQIQNFVDMYDTNRFIISCRTAAYQSSLRGFSNVIMADFDDSQIQYFISSWFKSEADKQAKTGDKCWEVLQKPENFAAKELAHTPLLLTFLCSVYDSSQKFPDNRSVLYQKSLRIFLEEWAAEKRVLRDEIYQGLHTELEEILLSKIAYTGFESDRIFFYQRDIVQQIRTFLAGNLNAPQHLDAEKVLNAIAVQQGILVKRAEHIFSFSHLTLQEYLTAQYIDDNHLVEQLVNQHLTDKRWKEVFLLVAGLMRGGADNLLLLMEKEAQKYINTPKLRDLLIWAEKITAGSQGDYKPVGKRTVAIANAITIAYAIPNIIAYAISIANANKTNIPNVLAYAIAITNANTYAIAEAIHHTSELEQLQIFNQVNFKLLIDQLEYLKAQVPEYQQPEQLGSQFAQHLQKTLLNTFRLNLGMIELSRNEWQTLESYLYINDLIIKCKQAAVLVSPQTWNAIEARMLLVQDIESTIGK